MNGARPDQRLTGIPARRLGVALRRYREASEVSLPEIAERLDFAFTPDVLEVIESGQHLLDEPQILLILSGYDVEPEELLPERQLLEFDDEGLYMAVGWTVKELTKPHTEESVLASYLTFVYELRDINPGTRIPLRQVDLVVLSNTIDWSTEKIRDHLTGLMQKWGKLPPEDTEPDLDGREPLLVPLDTGSGLLRRLHAHAGTHPANGTGLAPDNGRVAYPS